MVIRNLNLTIEEEQLLLVLSLLGLYVPEKEPNSTASAAGASGGDLEAQRGLAALAELRMAARRFFFSKFFVAFTNVGSESTVVVNLLIVLLLSRFVSVPSRLVAAYHQG